MWRTIELFRYYLIFNLLLYYFNVKFVVINLVIILATCYKDNVYNYGTNLIKYFYRNVRVTQYL